MNNIEKKLDYVMRQNDAILNALGSLVRAYAHQNNLAIEECEEECEYVDDIEGLNK